MAGPGPRPTAGAGTRPGAGGPTVCNEAVREDGIGGIASECLVRATLRLMTSAHGSEGDLLLLVVSQRQEGDPIDAVLASARDLARRLRPTGDDAGETGDVDEAADPGDAGEAVDPMALTDLPQMGADRARASRSRSRRPMGQRSSRSSTANRQMVPRPSSSSP